MRLMTSNVNEGHGESRVCLLHNECVVDLESGDTDRW